MRTTFAVALAAAMSMTAVASAAPAAGDDRRDEETATTISAVGSVASVAALVASVEIANPAVETLGTVVAITAPAAGHYYAGEYWTAGTGLRLAGLGLAGFGAVMRESDDLKSQYDDPTSGGTGSALLVGGLMLYSAGLVYDVATADNAARRYNESHELSIAPAPIKDAHGQTSAGVAIMGRF